MGYQALLFCPDQKLARVVSQVFSELDFTVEPVHEPFAAVKKLMAQRYDAIVVDCENEQNASLLFKSARNSSFNQNSLAIALVEGQAGVAKAYRIGANLVLTKPINVEQAKGTLRVARGLLRKNSDAAGASSVGTAASTTPANAPANGSSFQPAARIAAVSAPTPVATLDSEATLPAMAASAKIDHEPAIVPAPAAQTRISIASDSAVDAQHSASPVKPEAVKTEIGKIALVSSPAQNASSAFPSATGSAAAPAPAKEAAAPPATESKIFELEPASSTHAGPSYDASQDAASTFTSDAPTFGASDEEDSGGSGGSKKILVAAVAVLALAVLGYLGYTKLSQPANPGTAAQPLSASQNSLQSASIPTTAPTTAPLPVPSQGTPARGTATSASKTGTVALSDKPSAGVGNSPAIRIAANDAATSTPETKKPDPAPLQVKSTVAAPKTQAPAPADDSAPALPSSVAAASASDGHLSGLMSSTSSVPPPPATLRISQGVSQGLVIKRVQPKYPQAALAVHAQGIVQLEATINKEGSIANLKVLSGDAVLARAAVDAVRQWRYKPYYLDGEPVEIQTQITVNFKAN